MTYRTFDLTQIAVILRGLLPFLSTTLFIVLVSMTAGILLGLGMTWILTRPARVPRFLVRLFLRVMRGAPAVVLLLLVYYGLPALLRLVGMTTMTQTSRLFAVIATFSLIASAQMTNVFTAAYRAIPTAQTDAAKAAGYASHHRFSHLYVPQGLRLALPNIANTITWLLKEGAIAYTIGIMDVVGRAQWQINQGYGAYAVETYIALAIIFFVLIRLIEAIFGYLERRQKVRLS